MSKSTDHQHAPQTERQSRPEQPRSSPLYPLSIALMISAGIIVLIFGAFELAERALLSDLDENTRRALYRVRGIAAALITGLVVGWALIRSSPALLAATDIDEGLIPDRVRDERLRLYAQWFIAMRWIAVLVAGILVFLSVLVFELLPRESLWPLAATVGLLAACNVLYTRRIRRRSDMRRLLIWHAYLDLILFSVLLQFSGGVENPIAVFMLFQVIIGGILITRIECYRLAATGSLLFAAVALGSWSGFLPHYPLLLHPEAATSPVALHTPYVLASVGVQAAILLLTAYFVSTLSERLRRSERRLTALAERALADRKLLEQALESTSTGIRLLSLDLKPVWMNDRWKEWFGRREDTCRIFPEYGDIGCPGEDCLSKGELDVFEIERPPDGRKKQFFHITSAPIHDAEGKISQVAQLARDITARKEAHNRMMRAGQMAAVGELAGQIAHEVNNPIAIIHAKAELLLKNRKQEMSEKIALELGKIVDHTDRVARIAQGLLSYSRPSPTARNRVDLRQPIRKSISMIEHRARNREIRIDDRLADEPLNVTANATEMEQVFLNLFINAIQAMDKGGRLTISVLSRKASSGKFLAIAVDDTGAGIPPEMRELVFEPFFTTKQEDHGTGLGLSICQGLLRSHQGDILIEDAAGGGARFVVRLPLE